MENNKARIYLNPSDTVDELRKGIDKYIKYYNFQRPHSSLDVLLPAMKYGLVASKDDKYFVKLNLKCKFASIKQIKLIIKPV